MNTTRVDFNSLDNVILGNIETVLKYFGLEYTSNKDNIVLSCPVHGSDNIKSMTIYRPSLSFTCWTRHCEEEIGKGLHSLVKHLLDKRLNKKHSSEQIAFFIKNLTGSEIEQITSEDIERRQFNNFNSTRVSNIVPTITRNKVRINLKIPSEYFISRGFSERILNRYDIGFCFKRGDELFMRHVIPVYNEDFKLIGRLGRTVYNKCIICDMFHHPHGKCPTNSKEMFACGKWKNSFGFSTGECLYNLWYASEHIKKSKSAILVEGCGDVLRLEEAGINIGLGLFGLAFTEQKLEILNKLGIMNIYLALDNDKAGIAQTDKIYNRISKYFNVEIAKIGQKDIGDTPIDEVKEIFKGIR